MGVFENHQSADVFGKLLLSSECLNLDFGFTLQTMDPRLMCILAESADESEESTQLGYFQEKSLMSGLRGAFYPPQGRRRREAEIRLRLMGNFCLNKVEVIMGSVTLTATVIYTGARRPALLGSFVSSQPAFPGHINRWFSEAGWKARTS